MRANPARLSRIRPPGIPPHPLRGRFRAREALKPLALLLVLSLCSVAPPRAGTKGGEAVPDSFPETSSGVGLLRVHFFDVGQGDATLIQCPDGSTILIDGGATSSAIKLMTYLRETGVEVIDLLIATHPDGDHIGGLVPVLRKYPVKTVLDPGKSHTTATYRHFLEAVKAKPDSSYKLARAGQVYTFGRVKLTILGPRTPLPKSNNDCSVVCRLSYGKVSFLFTGDAEEKAEKSAMRSGFSLRSSVLKVGHHGSKSSTGRSFLAAVSPRAALISCGEGNRYGHPHPSVMRKLEGRKVKIYRTDEMGTVVFESRGGDCRIRKRGKIRLADHGVPPEHAGKVIGNRWTSTYYLPSDWLYLKVPPEARDYLRTEAEAKGAGYHRGYW